MNIYVAPTYTKFQLENLDDSQVSFPFSDEDATYNGLSHRYALTDKYFQERGRNLQLEIDGSSPDKVNNFLSYLSMKVYNYIYNNSKSTRQQLNYMIAKRGIYGFTLYEYRQSFLEAMYIEGCYLLDNGDLSNVAGIDLDTMQNMSADVMRKQERDFHKDAIGLLTQLGLHYYGKYWFFPHGSDW